MSNGMNIQNANASPLVSIIIPVYNTEQYLPRCLDSVCGQTEQNIEIIVVNDASPDNSQAIIDEYAKKDPRIVALRHTYNKHLGGARNTGIEASRGEYILFLDSDDYIREDAVALMLQKTLSNTHVDLVVCGIYKVAERDGALVPLDALLMERDECVTDVLQWYIDGRIFHCAWAKLWRRDLWLRTGLRFPEQIAEDIAVVPLLLSKARMAIIMPERLFYYQQRASSITAGDGQLFIENQMKAFVWQQEQWSAMNVASPMRELLVWRMVSEICTYLIRLVSEDNKPDAKAEPKLFVDIMRRPDLAQFFARIMDDAGPMRGLFLAYATAHAQETHQKNEAAERKRATADKKLKQRRKIIVGLFAYALVISAALLAVILL